MPEFRMQGNLDSLEDVAFELWEAGCLGLEERGDFLVAHFANRLELNFLGTWFEDSGTDWVEQYKNSLSVLRIGKIVVVPNNQKEQISDDEIPIFLEPGLAFGTGQHETTRMAILALEKMDLQNKVVLDVGAGSGILAIVAAKLGADAFGIDLDAQTVPVAVENAKQNQANTKFFSGTLEDVGKTIAVGAAHVIVANLFAELHATLMQDYVARLRKGGKLILTGIMVGTGLADEAEQTNWQESGGREALVQHAILNVGFTVTERQQLGDWVLLEAQKNSGEM